MTMVSQQPKGAMQDRIREILLSYGERDVDITVEGLAAKSGFKYPQVYQTLYRLQRIGEIEIINQDPDSPRSPVVGVKLLRMSPIGEVAARVEEHKLAAQVVKETRKLEGSLRLNTPNVLNYIDQRLAVERASEELKKANIDPNTVIRFEPNPLGEEAILLLEQLTQTHKRAIILENDLAAAERNTEYYKNQLGDHANRTFNDSGT